MTKFITMCSGAMLVALWPHATVYGEDSTDSEMDTITVSGVRTAIRADAMSNAITIITADDMADQQIFQVADLLRQVPGISISRSGALGSQAQLRMRGAEANHVLVLIDGVEANDPASGDEFLFEHLTAVDIERIEIIRGPQSALWGSDAVAGVINIVTRSPQGGMALKGHIEAGSFGTIRGGAGLSMQEDAWQMSLSAAHSQSKGSNNSRGGEEKDGYKNTSINAKFKITPSDTVSLQITARHIAAENEYDGVDYFVTGLPTDGDLVSNVRRTYLGVEGNLSLLDGRWTHKATLNWMDSDNQNYAFGAKDGATMASRLKMGYQTTFALTKAHRITGVIEHEKTNFEQVGIASFWGDPNQTQKITSTGYIIDYVGEILEPLTIVASLRHDQNSDFDNITTWRAGANYHIKSSDTHFRFSVGKGQKAPSFIERFGYFSALFIGQPTLRPERSTSYELGFDQTFMAGRATLSATYYNATLSDEINGFVWEPTLFMYTAENLAGESKREGFEVAFSAKVNAAVSVFANYSFTNAKEPDGLGGLQTELRRPRNMASAGVHYTLDGGANVNLSASYTGQHKDIFFPPWPNPSEIVTLKGYVLVRLAAEYPISDAVSLYGRMENAFNANYEDLYGFNTPGRGAYAGLRFTF